MPYSYSDLITDLSNYGNQWLINRSDTATSGGLSSNTYRWFDRFLNISGGIDGRSPTTPTTPVACSSATLGAIPLRNSANRLTLIGMDGDWRATTGNTTAFQETFPFLLADRLSHQGGLSGTASGNQTTNLPTAALTRYTSGVGVMIGISIYSALGATSVDIVASYTNSAGVSGRTTSAYPFPSNAPSNSFYILPLQPGDLGVRSVESVNLSASSGTTGNFGITLFRPIGMWLEQYSANSVGAMPTGMLMGGMPQILNDACLFMLTPSNVVPATCNIIVTEI